MAKRKSTKGQTTIYKTYNKTKDQLTRTPLKTRVWIQVLRKGKCQIKHTDLFDITVITTIVLKDLMSQWKSSFINCNFYHCILWTKLVLVFNQNWRFGYFTLLWEILLLFRSFCCTPLGKRQNDSHSWKISLIFNKDLCKTY
jgi:hypothetical protein